MIRRFSCMRLSVYLPVCQIVRTDEYATYVTSKEAYNKKELDSSNVASKRRKTRNKQASKNKFLSSFISLSWSNPSESLVIHPIQPASCIFLPLHSRPWRIVGVGVRAAEVDDDDDDSFVAHCCCFPFETRHDSSCFLFRINVPHEAKWDDDAAAIRQKNERIQTEVNKHLRTSPCMCVMGPPTGE